MKNNQQLSSSLTRKSAFSHLGRQTDTSKKIANTTNYADYASACLCLTTAILENKKKK